MDPKNLTLCLRSSKSIEELQHLAKAHSSIMNALHDCVVCVSSGRLGGGGGGGSDERTKAKNLYITASRLWLGRPVGSIGREARNISNILHAGAKLEVDPCNEVFQRLLDEAVILSNKFEAQGAANTLWAVATLQVEESRVIDPLVKACMRSSIHMKVQEVANSLWAIAKLNVTSSNAINSLTEACINRIHLFNAQDASNCLWAVAKLGVSDHRVIEPLTISCKVRVKEMSIQNAVNCLWAAAKLGVSDRQVIESLTSACTDRVKDLTPQGAANSFWAIATLGVSSSDAVIDSLSTACADRVHLFNARDAANCLWAACVLNVKNPLIMNSLTAAVSTRFSSIVRLDECQQCLQASCNGVSLSIEALNHFRSVTQAQSSPISTSASQRSVAAALSRLGFTPQLEVQIFNGILTVDIVIELTSSAHAESNSRIAIEFDGPTHYLRPAIGSTDQRVGPINGKSRFRNALIGRSGEFRSLISIPFYEWDALVGNEGEERYLRHSLQQFTIIHPQRKS